MMVRPVQSFLFAHTPAVVVYDCPMRNLRPLPLRP